MSSSFKDRPMTAEQPEDGFMVSSGHVIAVEQVARLDELYRTVRALIGQADAYWPSWVRSFVDTRRREIGRG